jgi:hypothetical protein
MTSNPTSSSLSSPPSHRRSDLLGRLEREWVTLQHRPAALARARSWRVDAEFTSLDDLVAASGFFTSSAERLASCDTRTHHEVVLAQLVRAAQHDELAARVVLQRLLPGLVACARRWSGRSGGTSLALDEVVTAAWGVIRTFPPNRLVTQVAARLLRDCEHQAFVKHTRRTWVQVPTEPGRLDQPVLCLPDPEPIAELAELVAEARNASFSNDDLRLLQLLMSGRPITEVASELDVSVRTVNNHRNAMVHRLRQVAFAA